MKNNNRCWVLMGWWAAKKGPGRPAAKSYMNMYTSTVGSATPTISSGCPPIEAWATPPSADAASTWTTPSRPPVSVESCSPKASAGMAEAQKMKQAAASTLRGVAGWWWEGGAGRAGGGGGGGGGGAGRHLPELAAADVRPVVPVPSVTVRHVVRDARAGHKAPRGARSNQHVLINMASMASRHLERAAAGMPTAAAHNCSDIESRV
jgi:hypothetical protein